MTQRGGASWGVYTGTRTVCSQCAAAIDQSNAGASGRCALLAAGYAGCLFVGWQMLVNDAPLFGLMFIFGFPLFPIAWIAAKVRGGCGGTKSSEAPATIEQSSLARRQNETVSEWVERMLAFSPELDRRTVEAYARGHPPQVGQSFSSWVESWPEWNPEWDSVHDVKEECFRRGDTLVSWAERIANRMDQLGLREKTETSSELLSLAKYVKPQVGETFDAFQSRFRRRFDTIDRNLDLSSPDSGPRQTESLTEWLCRIGPLFLTVEEGESIDDVIPKLASIAERYPPEATESARAWLDRVAPAIDAMNAA